MLLGTDFIFIFATFSLSFLLGLPFLLLVPSSHFHNKYLASPIFGYGFIGFLTTVLYKHRVSELFLFKILWMIGFLILGIALYQKFKTSRQWIQWTKTNTLLVFFLFLAFTLIFLPYWVGGLQFSGFQGWIWDQFAYIGSALTYQHKTFAQVIGSNGYSYIQDPVSLMGAIEIGRRPTVAILFGFFSEISPEETYRWGYLYVAFFVTNGILAATFLMRNIFHCSTARALMVASAFFVGFWGQVYIDFNAWSMSSVIPILLLVVTYVCTAARHIGTQNPLTIFELFPLSCLIGFAFYLYPEDSMFHLPGLVAIVIVANFINLKQQLSKKNIISSFKVILAGVAGLFLCVFFWQGTIGYLMFAAKFAAQNVMTRAVYGEYLLPMFGQANWLGPLLDKAVYYSGTTVHSENQGVVLSYILKHIFVDGHLEVLYYLIVDGFYGFLGVYFFTPLASVTPFIQEFWRALLAINMIAFIGYQFKSYIQAASKFRLFFVFVGLICTILICFLCATRIFAMARGIFYVAPYCFILFFIPFLSSEKIVSYKNTFYIFLILSQFGFGVARIVFAAQHHLPLYSLPYSFARAHYFPEAQTQYDWNLSRFDAALNNCHRVYVDISNGWQEYAVVYYLYSKNKEFVKKLPVRTSFWAVDPIGYQALNGMEDCTFSTIKKIMNHVEFNELQLTPYQR